jgi:hypothetical protein
VPESIANKKTFGKNFKPPHSNWPCHPPIKNDPEADRCTENIITNQTGDICQRYLCDTMIIEFEHLSYHVITVKLIRSLWAAPEFSTPEYGHRIEIT